MDQRSNSQVVDKADNDNVASYHRCVAGFVEAALEIRNATKHDDIACAVTIDEELLGSNERAEYIASVAENGGLSVATLRGDIQAFCCLDHGYFFGKPFISLLIVSFDARRLGLATGLLSYNSSKYQEVWTSTNQSNSAMRKLLDEAAWRYCGKLSGLDEGDPERFYRSN